MELVKIKEKEQIILPTRRCVSVKNKAILILLYTVNPWISHISEREQTICTKMNEMEKTDLLVNTVNKLLD